MKDYIACKAYKVVSNDYDDTIVTDLSSLKAGIANELCQQELILSKETRKAMAISLTQIYG